MIRSTGDGPSGGFLDSTSYSVHLSGQTRISEQGFCGHDFACRMDTSACTAAIACPANPLGLVEDEQLVVQ